MMDMHKGSRAAAAPGVRVGPRPGNKQAGGRARDQQGQTSVEMAMALPVLLMMLTGSLTLGLALNNDMQLTYATDAAAQALSISRGQTTDPCGTASQAAYSAAPSLSQSSLNFTIVLNTQSYGPATKPSCSGAQQYLVQFQNAKVTTTYPCNLNIFGFNPAPSCTLQAQTTVLIQ